MVARSARLPDHVDMTHDQMNDFAARVLLAASLSPFTIVQAEYAPGDTVPAWAEEYGGVRTEWLVNGDVEDMTPYPLPMTLDVRVCCAPIGQLRAIELVGSMLSDY